MYSISGTLFILLMMYLVPGLWSKSGMELNLTKVYKSSDLVLDILKREALIDSVLSGFGSIRKVLLEKQSKKDVSVVDSLILKLNKSSIYRKKLLEKFAGKINSVKTPEVVQVLLSGVFSYEKSRSLSSRLKKLRYSVESIYPEQLLEGIAQTYGTIIEKSGKKSYTLDVLKIDPEEPHSMEDPVHYAYHRVGKYVFDFIISQKIPVEFHDGPFGLAFKSLRNRGYGYFHRFLAPGIGAGHTDGTYIAFNLLGGKPVIFYTGSYGRERFLHNQAMYRIAKVPGSLVTCYYHEYDLSRLFGNLTFKPKNAGDIVVMGFSGGPIRSLIARENTRRIHEKIRKTWPTSLNKMSLSVGLTENAFLLKWGKILEMKNISIFNDYSTYRRFRDFYDWLLKNSRSQSALNLIRTAELVVLDENQGADFLRMRRFLYEDDTGQYHRLLALGAFWGELAREAAEKLTRLGYRKLLFCGIAGGLGKNDRIGDIHRYTEIYDEHGMKSDPEGRIFQWLPGKFLNVVEHSDGKGVGTFSPLTETSAVVEKWKSSGFTTVEMEVHHIVKGMLDAGIENIPALETLLVVSDIPGDHSGNTLESRFFHRKAVSLAGEKVIDILLKGIGATRFKFEDKLPQKKLPPRVGIFR